MNNPVEIVRTLNRHLTKPTELTLFGRAALALVDGIIPIASGDPDIDFWLAQQATNEELKNRGLYITHLFSETDVILRPNWLSGRIAINLELEKLRLFRPATIDLILTKMARGDEQDLEDIRFLFSREPTSQPKVLQLALEFSK
jgi:hypothetical protein